MNQYLHSSLLNRLFVGIASVGLLFGASILGGCNDAQAGALLGAGIGALAGQAIGQDTEATLIGVAIGTGAGYIIGNESDKEKAARSNYQYAPTAPPPPPIRKYKYRTPYSDQYHYRDFEHHEHYDGCGH